MKNHNIEKPNCIPFESEIKDISKNILINVLSSLMVLFILFLLFINYDSVLKFFNSKDLYTFIAKELKIENHSISENINSQINAFYEDYNKRSEKDTKQYGDQFLFALKTLVDDEYPEFLKNNLIDIKSILDEQTHTDITSLYYDLTFYWINLQNGSFGTDTALAFASYFKVINKYKWKFSGLRQKLHDKNFKIFDKQYWLPINLLIFEIYLRTLAITPSEADIMLKTNAKFLFEITQRNLDNTFMILSMDD